MKVTSFWVEALSNLDEVDRRFRGLHHEGNEHYYSFCDNEISDLCKCTLSCFCRILDVLKQCCNEINITLQSYYY
jgi:hypothetical protein